MTQVVLSGPTSVFTVDVIDRAIKVMQEHAMRPREFRLALQFRGDWGAPGKPMPKVSSRRKAKRRRCRMMTRTVFAYAIYA